MTGVDATGNGETRRTRRQVLTATLGAAGLIGLAGCGGGSDGGDGGSDGESDGGGSDSDDGAATDGSDSPVTVGIAIPQTGGYINEGEQMRFGYDLAARNLNETSGVANTDRFQKELGGGILDRPVELAYADTESSEDGARSAAGQLLDNASAVALMGGASSGETLGLQAAATDRSSVYMGGFAPGTSATGDACSKYAFHEMFNTKLIGQALVPVLTEEFGESKKFAQVYPRSTVGKEMFQSMFSAFTNKANWRHLTSATTRVGTRDFAKPLQKVVGVGPDVVFLNYYGLDGAVALQRAQEIVGEDVDVVAPLYNRPMAENAGGAIEGVIGTVHWDSTIRSAMGGRFVSAWRSVASEDSQRPRSPSGLSHLAYMQLFQYAAAAERAGSLAADDVVSELEGHTYDIGTGGEETMRACDHQAMRPVPVVRGLPAEDQYSGRYYELVDVRTGVEYGCDASPASSCSF